MVSGSGGVRLRVRWWDGDDDDVPFLLVHGLSSNARLWDGVAAVLSSAGHAAAAVDLRGHGHSGKPQDGYDFATVTDDLLAVVNALDFDPPIVVGQSWGGNLALEMGWRWPQLVRGVACVDGGWIELAAQFPQWEQCAEMLAPPPLEGVRAADIEAWLKKMHTDWPASGIQATLANFEHRPDGTVAPWLSRRHHLLILRSLWEHRPSERYPEIKVPVLLIPADSGAACMDKVRAEVAAAESALTVSRTVWIPGDHDLHAQHPRALAEVLLGAVEDSFF